MDREEKLRAAKEKLKKFQKKRQNENESPLSGVYEDFTTNMADTNNDVSDNQRQTHFKELPADPGSFKKIEDTTNSIQVRESRTDIDEIVNFDVNVQGNQRPNPLNSQCNTTQEVLKEKAHIRESASRISSAQFVNCEQLKSAFAAYEENQLQKLKEENVVGVVNFDFDRPSMSTNLGESSIVSLDSSNKNTTDDQQRNILEGTNLKMSLIHPEKLPNSESDNSIQANKHQSLSEQIAGVLSKTEDSINTSELVPNASSSILGDCGNNDGISSNMTNVSAENDRRDNSQINKEMSKPSDDLEAMQKLMQQQASSILHFKAYCESLTLKLEAAEAKLEAERDAASIALEKEVGILKDQLKSQLDSLQILVEEKSSLEKSLLDSKTLVLKKEDEIQSIQESLKEAQSEKSETELLLNNSDSVDRTIIEALKYEGQEQKQKITDLSQEVAELSSKFSQKENEVIALSSQLLQSNAKLEMTELNLKQLRSANNCSDDNNAEYYKGEEDSILSKTENTNQSSEQDNIISLRKLNEAQRMRLEELTLYIQQAAEDREQIIHQYTSYSQQLTTQIETLTNSLNETKVINHNIACREADLIKHVQQLEDQLQKMIQNRKEEPSLHSMKSECLDQDDTPRNCSETNEFTKLKDELLELQKENEELHLQKLKMEKKVTEHKENSEEYQRLLEERQQQISDMETQLEMESEKPTGQFDQSFIAACESDKVAASRAVAQNQQLKEQLEELELAVIQVTNSKAELANELDNIRTRFENLKEEETMLTSELSGLRDGIKERDRNTAAMKEQMKYYINFAENSIHGHLDGKQRNMEAEHEAQVEALVKEVQGAKEDIRILSSHNSELRSQLEVLAATATTQSSAQSTRESSGGPNTPIVNQESEEMLSQSATRETSASPSLPSHLSPKLTPETGASTSSDTSSGFSPLPSTGNSDSGSLLSHYEVINNQQCNQDKPALLPQSNLGDNSTQDNTMADLAEEETPTPSIKYERIGDIIPPLSPEVALLKLQQKFKKAMHDNVELSTEKEQLEHLVIQLQDETDTIGEYITIYQHQRQQQRLSLAEKEAQLHALSRDREELKNKLNELQFLVKHFLKQEKGNTGNLRNINDNVNSFFTNRKHLGSLASSSTSIFSEVENDFVLNSNPSTPRNLSLELPNGNYSKLSHKDIEFAEDELESHVNNSDLLEYAPKTKAVIINDKDNDNEFTITSIPEGADIRNNLNEDVGEFRTIIMPESESNSAEEVIIVPQTTCNSEFGAGNNNQQTADKILALISEIGSNQILQKDEKNFHPWFWEHSQGQVMTI